ncbi:plasmid-partitioning protein SopA, partial [Salmonella enterica subsp. enterica serovar Typhimurium]
VCAADVIELATPAEQIDNASDHQIFTMQHDLLETVDMGGYEPVVSQLLTKYSLTNGNQSRCKEEQIRNTRGAKDKRQ